jgi:hypothetical protein
MAQPIIWLELKDYNKVFESNYKKYNRFLEEVVSTELKLVDMQTIIESQPFQAESDDLGKTVIWFGMVEHDLFYIMNFIDSPYPKTVLGAESFELLAKLEELGPTFFKNITWIANMPNKASHSVYTFNRQDHICEVYRASEIEEANTTAYFLNKRGQCTHFYVDAAEDQNQTWLVMEQLDQGQEKEIGRYVHKLSAESFAFDYGIKNKKKILIKKL